MWTRLEERGGASGERQCSHNTMPFLMPLFVRQIRTSPSVSPTLCPSINWRMAGGIDRRSYKFCLIILWRLGLEESRGIISNPCHHCIMKAIPLVISCFGKSGPMKGLGVVAGERKFRGCLFIHLMDSEGLLFAKHCDFGGK